MRGGGETSTEKKGMGVLSRDQYPNQRSVLKLRPKFEKKSRGTGGSSTQRIGPGVPYSRAGVLREKVTNATISFYERKEGKAERLDVPSIAQLTPPRKVRPSWEAARFKMCPGSGLHKSSSGSCQWTDVTPRFGSGPPESALRIEGRGDVGTRVERVRQAVILERKRIMTKVLGHPKAQVDGGQTRAPKRKGVLRTRVPN